MIKKENNLAFIDAIFKKKIIYIIMIVFSVFLIVFSALKIADLNGYKVIIEDVDNTYSFEEERNSDNELIVTVKFKKPTYTLSYSGIMDAPHLYDQYYRNAYSYTKVNLENVIYKGKKEIDRFYGDEETERVYNIGDVESNMINVKRNPTDYKISFDLKFWFVDALIIVGSSFFIVISLICIGKIARAEG